MSNKQRKLRWIRAKNEARKYPDCTLSSDIFCHHVLDDLAFPCMWVDFRLFHPAKKCYYAVALETCWFAEACDVEDSIIQNHMNEEGNIDLTALSDEIEALVAKVEYVKPAIKVVSYGHGVLGVLATINTQYIKEAEINAFAAHLKELGLPTKSGWKWSGGPEPLVFPPRERL